MLNGCLGCGDSKERGRSERLPLCHRPPNSLGRTQIPDGVLPQVAQAHVLGETVSRQLGSHSGEHGLAAVGHCAQAGSAVHGGAVVVAACGSRATRSLRPSLTVNERQVRRWRSGDAVAHQTGVPLVMLAGIPPASAAIQPHLSRAASNQRARRSPPRIWIWISDLALRLEPGPGATFALWLASLAQVTNPGRGQRSRPFQLVASKLGRLLSFSPVHDRKEAAEP
jgi:hypothetical protein